jgi:hypothetical protein
MDVSPYQAAKELGDGRYATQMYAMAKQCLRNGGPHPTLPLIAIQVGTKIWFLRSSFDSYASTQLTFW